MYLSSALSVLAWVTTSTATSIILPLYVYPLSGAWTPVFNAITSSPNVHWQVVINPSNGSGPANTYPNSDYVAGINQLNSYKNVETIGYVHTLSATRPYSEVTTEIETYAYWATCTSANLSINGIWFDEAPTANLAAPLQYMANASAFAYNTVPTADTTVIFNPGSNLTALQYFNYANTIIEFEDYYSNYMNQTTINYFPSGGKKQSGVLVHTYTGTTATLQSLVHTGIINKLAGMYFTDDDNYQDLNIVGQVATAFAKG